MQQQVLFLLVMYMSLQCHQSLSFISCISPAHFMLFCFYHRSSKVTRSSIYLGANRKRIHVCNFLLVINSNIIYITVFEILTHNARKQLVLPIPPMFYAPVRGTRQNFWIKIDTYSVKKLEGWARCMVKIA